MQLSLLKYINLSRFINLVKVFSGYVLSIFIKKPFVWGFPVSASIEPTNLCNLFCPECPAGNGTLTRPTGKMSFDTFKKIIDEISGYCFYLQLFFQGEPLLNKELFKMIEYANRKKMYTVLNTNGQLFNESAVEKLLLNPPDKIIFSIDGITEEMYSSYRKGGSLEKAISGLKNLSAQKKRQNMKNPLIEFQMIIMKQNENYLREAEQLAESSGAGRILFKSMQVYDDEGAKEYLPDNPDFRRYRSDRKVIMKNRLRNKCFSLWRTLVITWEGKLIPCCFDKNADYEIGLLNDESLKKLWCSDKFTNYRKKILTDRKSSGICTNCSEGINTDIYSRTF